MATAKKAPAKKLAPPFAAKKGKDAKKPGDKKLPFFMMGKGGSK